MPSFVLRLLAVLTVVALAIGSYWFLTQPTTPAPSTTTSVAPTVVVGEPVVEEEAVAVVPATETSVPSTATALPPTFTPLPTATLPPRLSELQIVDRYGNQSFASLEEMPPEVRRFYEESIAEIATFFQVRQEDLLALVQQQGGGQFRVPLAEGETISLVPSGLWNGPGTPPGTALLTNAYRIEQAGGMGVGWLQRHQWLAWVQGRGATNLNDITVDPYRFTNGAATLARYLAAQGATTTLAAQDEAQFEARLNGATVGLVAATNRAALAAPADPAGNEWAGALQRILDDRLGMALPADEAIALVDGRGIAGRSADPADGATILYTELVQDWLTQARAAASENRPLPWPYVQDETDVAVQELAVQLLGHVLTAPELRSVRTSGEDNLAQISESLSSRTEATLYRETRAIADEGLQRSARGLRLWNYEVSNLVQSALATGNNGFGGGGGGGSSSGNSSSRNQTRTQIRLRSEVQYFLRRLPDYRAIHGDQFFSATPFDPMVSMGQPYGSPVDYQAGGIHTGVDIRARGSGDATLIHAVEAGTVAHVGPLFCLSDSACRGPYAVVIDHGGNVYTVYSHNSEAFVSPGEQVTAGQVIARQGSEGYSRGPHLHLELHVGSPYSGVWTDPWRGGQYIDPWPWLPKEGEALAPAS